MKVNPFENLSFQVNAGEFLGIAGPSGIGKSSILKCVYRTYLPSAGTILYDSDLFGELDLARASERQMTHLRVRELGYVSQFFKVIPRIPAIDVVADRLLPLGYSEEDARGRASALLERLNIPRQLWQAYPATFSGGEQQRVNLARAFIARPRLLILDEPTASLDYDTKLKVLDLLREMKQEGTTMIGVFHDWDVMGKIADRVLDLRAHRHQAEEQEAATGI